MRRPCARRPLTEALSAATHRLRHRRLIVCLHRRLMDNVKWVHRRTDRRATVTTKPRFFADDDSRCSTTANGHLDRERVISSFTAVFASECAIYSGNASSYFWHIRCTGNELERSSVECILQIFYNHL